MLYCVRYVFRSSAGLVPPRECFPVQMCEPVGILTVMPVALLGRDPANARIGTGASLAVLVVVAVAVQGWCPAEVGKQHA